jgi:hypothetical protein
LEKAFRRELGAPFGTGTKKWNDGRARTLREKNGTIGGFKQQRSIMFVLFLFKKERSEGRA